jgi:hypothetical protein
MHRRCVSRTALGNRTPRGLTSARTHFAERIPAGAEPRCAHAHTRTRTRFDFQEHEDVLNGSFEKSRVAGAFPGEEFPGSPPRKQARSAPRAGFWTAEAYKKPTKGPRSWTTNFSPLGQEAADRRHFNDQNLSWRRIRGEKIGEVEIRRATFAPRQFREIFCKFLEIF